MTEIELIISDAREAFAQSKPEEALAILDKITVENCSEAIFLKGEIYFKLQKWGEALNHFMLYKDLVPSDKNAESYCIMIQNILGFFHKDLYNP